MTTKTVDVREAQARLGELLSLVMAGTEVILTERNRPLARLVPYAAQQAQRKAGLHAGAILVTDDFDEPLPDEFWTGTS